MTPQILDQIKAHGLSLVEVSDRVEVRKGAKVISFDKDRDKAVTKALERLEAEKPLQTAKPVVVGSPVNPDQDVARQGEHRQGDLSRTESAPVINPAPSPIIKGSVVKSKYRERYKATGYNCGDLIAGELQAYVCKLVGNRMQVDPAKLKEVAVANEVWNDRYTNLNMGLQRMTIGNRLRHRYDEGIELDIGGCKFQQTWE